MKISRIKLCVGLLLALPLAGCASLTDWKYEQTQHCRARAAYKACGNPCGECYPKDYRSGWLDGYYDGLTGGGCCPPAIAPAKYWDPHQILDDCDNRRHAYYSGWQDGAAAAANCPDTHYLKVHETCDCPMPRCEGGCQDEKPCGCQQACGCQDALGLQNDGQMIEILSDVPIGTTSGWSSEDPSDAMDHPPASDTEPVPEAPTGDSALNADLPTRSVELNVRPVGFMLPSGISDAHTTPNDLFGAW